MRPARIKMMCPACETALEVVVLPPVRGGRWNPPEPATIDEIVGCPHAEHLASDEAFYTAVLETLSDQEDAARERTLERG